MNSVSKNDIFPPEIIPGAIPPSVPALVEIIKEHPENYAAVFALACLYLRTGEAELAKEPLRKLLEENQNSVAALCNLSVAHILLGEFDDAEIHLKKAVLLSSNEVRLHVLLARIAVLRGDVEAAIDTYRKVISLDQNSREAYLEIAQLFEAGGDVKSAKEHFDKALSLDPQNPIAQDRLGELCFREGEALYRDGKQEEAFAVWSKGFRRFSRAFAANQTVAREMKALVAAYVESRIIRKELKIYENSKRKSSDAFRLFIRFYFSQGLVPELYVAEEMIPSEVLRWQKDPSAEVIMPFPHFRLGVLYTLRGDFESALEQLTLSRDHLPKSKQRPLKLNEIISFVKDVGGLEEGEEDTVVAAASEDEWALQGFEDQFSREAWKKTGAAPEEAALWREKEFSPSQAAEWRKRKFSSAEAAEWVSLGFAEAQIAMRWQRAQFTPVDARQWSEEFPEDIETAIQSRNAGFSDPEIAKRWLAVFMFPSEGYRWFELGIDVQEAALFVAEGVTDPFIAREQILARAGGEEE